MMYWFGCPRCASKKYQRHHRREYEGVNVWMICECGHLFVAPRLYRGEGHEGWNDGGDRPTPIEPTDPRSDGS